VPTRSRRPRRRCSLKITPTRCGTMAGPNRPCGHPRRHDLRTDRACSRRTADRTLPVFNMTKTGGDLRRLSSPRPCPSFRTRRMRRPLDWASPLVSPPMGTTRRRHDPYRSRVDFSGGVSTGPINFDTGEDGDFRALNHVNPRPKGSRAGAAPFGRASSLVTDRSPRTTAILRA
jgi:hypothetical protein